MQIWDIHPGYLNDQDLSAELQQLETLAERIARDDDSHPHGLEVQRWQGHAWALQQRHSLVRVELELRQTSSLPPLSLIKLQAGDWPTPLTSPGHQFQLLQSSYPGNTQSRIPLPQHGQQLWRQHKYSIMARSPKRYQQLGQLVAQMKADDDISQLALELTTALHTRPSHGGTNNALQHMWGYVSANKSQRCHDIEHWPLKKLLKETQRLAQETQQTYLLHSTALSELALYV